MLAAMPWLFSRNKVCFEQREVAWIRALVSSDRHRIICEFEAPDAEALRESYRHLGIHFDQLWIAELYESK